MNQAIVVFLGLICSLSAFTIFQNQQLQGLQAINWPFSVCGDGDWKIQKLTLASQPARNANNDIDVLGTATADTSFDHVYINVKLNSVFLHEETVEFKKSYQQDDTVEFKYQNFVPSFAPPGNYGLQFVFKNNGKDNGCLAMSFKL